MMLCIRPKHPTRPFPHLSIGIIISTVLPLFLPMHAIRSSSSKPVIDALLSPYCFYVVVLGFVLVFEIAVSEYRSKAGDK